MNKAVKISIIIIAITLSLTGITYAGVTKVQQNNGAYIVGETEKEYLTRIKIR